MTTPPYCGAEAAQDSFLNHVRFLKAPFTPTYPFGQGPVVDPTLIASIPGSDNIQSDLIAAFAAAGQQFKGYLCDLNAIYINPCVVGSYDPASCSLEDKDIANSTWGVRTITSPPARYIALSLALWKNGHAPPLLDFETRRVRALLHTLVPNAASALLPHFVAVEPSTANSSGMSILQILAHEAGHIYWFDTFVVDPGKQFQASPGGFAVVASPVSQCFSSNASWTYPVDVPPGRWLDFGEIRNVDGNSELLQLPGLLNEKHTDEFASHLRNIYTGGRWVGLFGAFSTDEDFVTTLELSVILNATPSLQSLTLVIPRANGKSFTIPNILDNVNSATELGKKYQCFARLPALARAR